MQASPISRSAVSNTFVMLVISGGICVGVLPFAIYRWLHGDMAIATLNSTVALSTACIFCHLLFTKNIQVASVGIAILTVFSMTATIYLKGAQNLHWVYPSLTTTFFLLSPALAAYISLFFLIIVSILVFDDVKFLSLLTFFVSAGATFLFSFAFSRRMFHQAEILGHLATTDPLTGIGNRRKLEEKLIELSRKIKRYPNEACSLVLFDLDYFKQVNDKYGHGCGDEVLQGVTDVINQHIREVDSLYRLGGEEFVLVLENTQLNQANKIANKLADEIENTKWEPEDLCITTSAGIAQFDVNESTYEWMNRADKALYIAKESGRNLCINSEA